MQYNYVWESQEWFGDIAVNPYELKENDRVYTCGCNWRVVQLIDFDCEECGINHKAVVVGYRGSQFQTWPINSEEQEFWLNVVPLKHKDEYKRRFRRLHELNMQAFRDSKDK